MHLGKTPVFKDELNNQNSGVDSSSTSVFKNTGGNPSGPGPLELSKSDFFVYFFIGN